MNKQKTIIRFREDIREIRMCLVYLQYMVPNRKKNKIGGYNWLKFRVCVVDDFADKRNSNFASDLRETEKVRETVLACLVGDWVF